MLEIKTQGLCQGNGASPAGGTVVSICIVLVHKKNGPGAYFLCPITKLKSHIAGVIYVDDMEIIHFRMEDERDDALDAFIGIQEAITNWGKLFLATVSTLKPAKCFFNLISFSQKPDGTWYYTKKRTMRSSEQSFHWQTAPLHPLSTWGWTYQTKPWVQ